MLKLTLHPELWGQEFRCMGVEFASRSVPLYHISIGGEMAERTLEEDMERQVLMAIYALLTPVGCPMA